MSNFTEDLKGNMKRHMSNAPMTSSSYAQGNNWVKNQTIEPHGGNMINADLYERQNTFEGDSNYARHMPLLNNNNGYQTEG